MSGAPEKELAQLSPGGRETKGKTIARTRYFFLSFTEVDF
jgi:hypothetical protein